ncbi:MAG: hypothetical protein EZS26_001594 [Candidatus Ordinivivax streblomastigis]|uniref:Fibronectin type-III domain-containing protein n=1 Tax=Candidatus Ordinivivax streblomastigis TaxID=2540710 RepID=A0A5M8P1F5_9BACT|nr:MAG: hypothetical protein EZS26_001594 [Candidatus Ordinivivax streblomastigis]
MKKIIFIAITLSILFLGKVDAQTVYGYDFVSTTGTYTEITGGTVVWTGADNAAPNGALKDRVFYGAAGEETSTAKVTDAAGIPIGFNFTFDNQVLNQFAIDSYGFVLLGKDKITADPVSSSFLLRGETGNGTSDWLDGRTNVVGSGISGGFGYDVFGAATTEISYKLEGSGSSHFLTIQFKDLQVSINNGGTKATVSLQIRLYEGSNKVEFIYKDWLISGSDSRTVRVGLKGSLPGYGSVAGSSLIPTDIGNIHARTGSSWTNTSKGASGGATINWSSSTVIPDGLTFTFTPPSECSVPTAPTALTLTPTSSDISGSFTASGADRYLVLVSESSTLDATPENGKFYKSGDPVGNGTIVSFKTTTDFSAASEIVGSKDYYVFVFAANTYCASSPKYSTSPLTGSIKTLPAPPTLTIAEEGYTSVKLASVANASNDQILIALEVGVLDEDGNRNLISDGVFGTPTSALNVGNDIPGGGKVVYKGPASNAIVISDLTEDTFTHFAAWSFDGTGNFSTTVTKNNVLTWGKVPYEVNFSKFVPFEIPFGWKREGGNFQLPDPATKLECNLTAANASGAYNSITTQWLQLAEGKNKIILDLAITETTGSTPSFVTAPYSDWDAKDSLVFWVSNGIDSTSVYSIKKDNNNTLASGKLYVPIDNFGGEKVKIKIGWTTVKRTSLSITGYKVAEKPDCDYPTQYTVSAIGSSSATIQWEPNQGEELWDIRYRKVGSEWSNPIEVNTSSYQLSGLPASSAIEVQVRAKCSLIDVSPWSEAIKFTTGLGLPFSEIFDATAANNLPAGWRVEKGTIGNPTVFTDVAKIIRGVTNNGRNPDSSYNRVLRVQYNNTALNDWVIFPVLDLGDGSVAYKFEFDVIAYQGVPADLPSDDYLVAVISTDGGLTFKEANILNSGGLKTFAAGRQSISLANYSGSVQLAFYFKSTTAPSSAITVDVDNILITEATPSLVTSPSVSEITASGAKVAWEGTASDWLVFTRKAGETMRNYQTQTAKELVLSSLDPTTTYEVGITHSPALGDTAKVVIVPFTTLSTVACPVVTEITATPTPYTVALSWSTTRDAGLYNIHIRPVGYEGWITKTSTTKSLEIGGLVPNTTYEYAIQAVCSPATGDDSDWTTVASFATISASCFAPTALAATPTHKSAVISWEGEADNYELQTKTGLAEWISVSVIGAKTKTLDDLTPETAYSLRIRSICDDTDISLWSSISNFTTTAIPPCPLPFNLQATGITDSIAVLSWEANEENLSWDLRYREGGAAAPVWVNVENLLVKTYQLDKLTPETPYLWTVKAYCNEDRETAWAVQGEFTTLAPTGLNEISVDNLQVFVSNRIINILNPDGSFIKQIQLYDANGQVLKNFTINSSENVLIPLTNTQKTLLVKVDGKNESSTFKVLVK